MEETQKKINNIERTFRSGALSLTIWKNTTKDNKEWNSITISRGYQDDQKQWKNTNTLRTNDLPKVQMLCNKAFEYLTETTKTEENTS